MAVCAAAMVAIALLAAGLRWWLGPVQRPLGSGAAAAAAAGGGGGGGGGGASARGRAQTEDEGQGVPIYAQSSIADLHDARLRAMSKAAAFLADPPATDDRPSFDTIHKHGHQDLVQAVAFNGHGDRCATGSVDGKIRVFNRHKDGVWRLCDTWAAHASEILELQWLPTTIYPNLLASLGIEGRFKLWAEDPSAASGRRFAESTRNGPLVTIPSRSPYLGPNGTGSGAPATGMGSPTPAPASFGFDGGTAAGAGAAATAKPAFETRNSRSPYRSFSLKHLDDSRTTYLALLSADGGLTVYENDRVENLAAFTLLDEL
ncbi:hypothetical protein VTH06DRAFT_2421 [Thermothelomyces fergusii]